MTNHVHRIGATGQVARPVGRAHSDDSRWFNIKSPRTGHLWQNRFFSCPLDLSHLAHAMYYVELNVIHATLCASSLDCEWPSARAHAGLEPPPSWLDTESWTA